MLQLSSSTYSLFEFTISGINFDGDHDFLFINFVPYFWFFFSGSIYVVCTFLSLCKIVIIIWRLNTYSLLNVILKKKY